MNLHSSSDGRPSLVADKRTDGGPDATRRALVLGLAATPLAVSAPPLLAQSGNPSATSLLTNLAWYHAFEDTGAATFFKARDTVDDGMQMRNLMSIGNGKTAGQITQSGNIRLRQVVFGNGPHNDYLYIPASNPVCRASASFTLVLTVDIRQAATNWQSRAIAGRLGGMFDGSGVWGVLFTANPGAQQFEFAAFAPNGGLTVISHTQGKPWQTVPSGKVHLVYRWDDSTKILSGFVNGMKMSVAHPAGLRASTTTNFAVGQGVVNDTALWESSVRSIGMAVDEMAFFRYAASDADIAWLYNSGSPRYYDDIKAAAAPMPIAYASFQQPFSADSYWNAPLPGRLGQPGTTTYVSASDIRVQNLRQGAAPVIDADHWSTPIIECYSSDPVIDFLIDGQVVYDHPNNWRPKTFTWRLPNRPDVYPSTGRLMSDWSPTSPATAGSWEIPSAGGRLGDASISLIWMDFPGQTYVTVEGTTLTVPAGPVALDMHWAYRTGTAPNHVYRAASGALVPLNGDGLWLGGHGIIGVGTPRHPPGHPSNWAQDYVSGGVAPSRASGMANLGGFIRAGELTDPSKGVHHGTYLLMDPSRMSCRSGCSGVPVYPASKDDYAQYAGPANVNNFVMMGQRLAIPPSVNVETLPISEPYKRLARAWQNYGLTVGDQSGATGIRAERNAAKADAAALNNPAYMNILWQQLTIVTGTWV